MGINRAEEAGRKMGLMIPRPVGGQAVESPQAVALTHHLSKGMAALVGRKVLALAQEARPWQSRGQITVARLMLRLQHILRQLGSRLVTVLLQEQPPASR